MKRSADELDGWPRTLEGFEVHVRIEQDNDPDLSWLGVYKNKPPQSGPYYDRALERVVKDGDLDHAFEAPEPETHGGMCTSRVPAGECNCGVAQGALECYQCGKAEAGHPSEETAQEDNRKADRFKYRREFRYILPGGGDPDCLAQDAARLEDYERGEWCSVGVVATAYKAGVDLGSASIWGIESDSESSYFEETAQEQAVQAVDEARATLAELCRVHA